MSEKNYILGMDIGTTSIKVCIYDPVTKKIVAEKNEVHSANIPSDQGIEGNEQDVPKIVASLHNCVSSLPRNLLGYVTKIGICGQMHGVMLWKNSAWEKVEQDGVTRFDAKPENMSPLYTWQDNRCKPDFLDSLPKADSHLKCYTGYGCATLLWMAKYKPEKVKEYQYSGIVQDFIVAMLCDLETPVMSDQIAASWGYFDTEKNEWNIDILNRTGFPTNLLPRVLKSRLIAGLLSVPWNGIRKGTPVCVAMGDLQCSIIATLESPQDAVLNISTSAQVAYIANNISDMGVNTDTIMHVPYFDNTYLVVAASLNGGNVLVAFVDMVQQWMLDLGLSAPQTEVWDKLIALVLKSEPTSIKITPHLLGERHIPTAKLSVENVDQSNIQLGNVFRSLCDSLINNLHSMIPRDILSNADVKRIVGNGSALSRNAVLQRAIEHYYGMPLEFTSGGDAAKGAAVAIM